MRTFVYVDGFNLYYGELRKTAWRWLDLPSLFSKVLPPHCDILTVKYFTAKVSETPTDRSKPQRQDAYLRALCHQAKVQVYYGHFLRHPKHLPLVRPVGNQRTAHVIKPEEKGSDVNLAVHLLNDCWLNAYDCAVVVSNDGDIAEAMRLIRQHHDKQIGLIMPMAQRPRKERKPSKELKKYAHFERTIRPGALQSSQLPDPIPGTTLRKPTGW